MLVLLPPSEGKTPAPDDAAPLDLEALHHPGLNPWRRKVLDALAAVSARPDAARVLGLGPSSAAEAERNLRLPEAPAEQARRVYTGVLYAAAGLDSLEGAALARAEGHVRVVSALWGLLAPTDRVPAYRLSMGVRLPGLGPLAGVWRGPLADELDEEVPGRLVVDCRSADYAAAWRPPRTAGDWVGVRVVRGGRVVSHHAKHARGLLVGHLCRRPGAAPEDAEGLLAAAREMLDGHVLGARIVPGTGRQVLLELEVG